MSQEVNDIKRQIMAVVGRNPTKEYINQMIGNMGRQIKIEAWNKGYEQAIEDMKKGEIAP